MGRFLSLTARDLIFCWGPGLVSVDRRWQIKAELGADLLAQYSLLTDKQTEVWEETASPAISPCLWTLPLTHMDQALGLSWT